MLKVIGMLYCMVFAFYCQELLPSTTVLLAASKTVVDGNNL